MTKQASKSGARHSFPQTPRGDREFTGTKPLQNNTYTDPPARGPLGCGWVTFCYILRILQLPFMHVGDVYRSLMKT